MKTTQTIRRLGSRLREALAAPSEEGELTPEELAAAIPNLFGHARRRIRCYAGLVHVELRDFGPDDVEPLRRAFTEVLDELGVARLHDLNTITGRAIFTCPTDVLAPGYFARLADEVERACGLADRGFPLDRPKYPGDAEPVARLLVELAADSGAVALGTLLKAVDFKPTRGEFDLAAVVSLVENTPRLRRWLDDRLTSTAVDVGLGTAGAFLHAVGGGPVGPAIDLLLRTLRLQAELTRRASWIEREAALLDSPRAGVTLHSGRPSRVRPLPEGEFDRYSDEALFASLGGFAVGLLDTESLEAAFAPLFTGLPKAARYGRDAFLAEINRAFAARNMLVLVPGQLASLERISAAVVDARVLRVGRELDPHAANLLRAARHAGVRVTIVGGDQKLRATLTPAAWAPLDRAEWVDVAMTRAITQLQREGDVVMTVSAAAPGAFLHADFGVGLHREPVPPWEATVVGTASLDDATFALEAAAAARAVADESIIFASVGAAIGGLTAVGRGVERGTSRRVLLAVNAASIASLANGMRHVRELERRPRPLVAEKTMWHSLPGEAVVAAVGSHPEGLSNAEVSARRRATIEEPPELRKFARAVGRELVNPFTPVLAGGAALSAIVGSPADAAIVAAAIALSASIGGTERYVSERSIARLEALNRTTARVLRDGRWVEVPHGDLVLGDVIEVRAGEMVPADGRLLHAHGLELDQSSLTGESLTVRKSVRPSRATDIADRSSMIFEGSVVTNGEARAVVVAVGDATEAARADRLAEAAPESGVELRLRELAELTVPAAGFSGLLLAAVGLVQGRDLRKILGSSVGLAVASVPEGLPLLTTLAQLAAARRLARRGIIVRNPRTIEALGRIDVVCVDKTGTLTEGSIRFHGVSDGEQLDVALDPPGSRALLAAALRATPADRGQLRHATDRAIVAAADALDVTAVSELGSWSIVKTLPFGHDRHYHAVAGDGEDGRCLYVKGAPETILGRCTRIRRGSKTTAMRGGARERLAREADELAARGLRVLCLAMRSSSESEAVDDAAVSDLVFLGFVTFSDPLRGSSADAVRALREGGIRVLMITGDHARTAHRIGLAAGIVDEGEELRDVVVAGTELDQLGDDELAAALLRARVVARATPLHKVRIVRALQGAGHVVGMTGDGGNDASAIRLADVGIALGRNSSRAAREAADMVVVDPRLETILDGIAEGRALWPSVRDAVALLLGGNLGEIGFTVASGILGKKGGLNTRQLLLVNLLTDIAPAMTVALRPPTAEDLRRSLADAVDVSLGVALEEQITTRAIATGGGAAVAWALARMLGPEDKATTVALLSLVGAQLGQTIASGHQTRETLLASAASAALLLGLVETPRVSQIFGCRPVGPIGLGIAASTSVGATILAREGRGWRERATQFLGRAHQADAVSDPSERLGWTFARLDLLDLFGR